MKTDWLKVLIFAIPLFIAGVGYALTQVSFDNSSIIVAGQNIFITQPTTTTQACPASGNVAYKNSGFTQVPWTLSQGGAAANAFFCIDNQGTGTDTPSVTHSTPVLDGICPSTGNGLTWVPPAAIQALPPHTATTNPVAITICAGSGTPVGTGPSFTVTVT